MSLLDPNAPYRRSLVLAGGGIRVAYHAGVLLALEEAGLTFRHVDGTSGGIFGTAMLASGITPTDAARHWRRLHLGGFMKPLPFWDYLRWGALPALGSATGVRDKIFPELGISPDRIRSNEDADFTFNVCNFTQKVLQSIPGPEVTVDYLVAGISLPLFMPAVPIAGESFLDGVWIKDANLTEAYNRGAEEVWLVWCIGNTPTYRSGLFHQYVHMIEIAANGALFEEMDQLFARAAREGRAFRIHVLAPEYALPLDPDFVTGKIDADTLINMGYAEAKRYLAHPRALTGAQRGNPAVYAASTAMREPGPALHFRQQFRGRLAGRERQVNLGFFLRPTGPQLFGSLVWDKDKTVSGFDVTASIPAPGQCALSFRCLVDGQEYTVEVHLNMRALSSASVTLWKDRQVAGSAQLYQSFGQRLRNRWFAYVIGVDGVFARIKARQQLKAIFTQKPIAP
ncbi:patatin-like phospholipase family protein [Dinghuibacter silviterrae]|uniref:Patatin-like phospholipase n=1 Tax=Dinghuibacter silviterrae TaxID=1539049 RepID=A0A4V6Q9V6_9BACT|nr:patatin-like phospholipase family protein [Dinghuibacter silviterrae]TDW96752.1 patatin-like phospholipase [Dinghuibacter silviterrae]